MKIAVCVKAVPDAAAGRRIDPATKRLDRSGELAISDFDTYAVEEALRLKEAAGDGEVVVVSMGPEKAMDALRKALAMGADRAVLITDDALAGADLARHRARARRRARAGERRSRPLRPAVGRRRRRVPLGGGRRAPAAARDLAGQRADASTAARSPASARPSSATTRFARRCRRSSRCRMRSTRRATRRSRGSWARRRSRRRRCPPATSAARRRRARRCSALNAAARTRRGAQDRGRRHRRRADRRVPRPRRGSSDGQDARLPRAPRGRDRRRARSACSRRRAARRGRQRRARRLRRARRSPSGQARTERRPCSSPTTSASRAPLPQPRVDVLAKLVRDEGFDTVLFAQSVLAADVAAGLAARLGAGLNWDLVDLDR